MFGKKKKMTKEVEQYYLNNFGTTNEEVIKNMVKELNHEKVLQRINTYIDMHIGWDDANEINKVVFEIINFEKNINKKQVKIDDDLIKTIFEVDKEILHRQFVKNGYSEADAKDIVSKNYFEKDVFEFRSLKVDDYIIGENSMVQKTVKERFDRYKKETNKDDVQQLIWQKKVYV